MGLPMVGMVAAPVRASERKRLQRAERR